MGFKKARENANMTQIQVSNALNIPQSTIASWEAGIALPRADKLVPLAQLYGCTVDDLLRKDMQND